MPLDADILAIVRRSPLFAEADTLTLEKLLARATRVSLRPEQILFLAGSPAEAMFLVLSGQVRVFALSTTGDQQILHLYGPGDTIAEAAMFAGQNYPANAAAVTASAILALRRDHIRAAMAADPDLAMSLIASLSGKLRQFASLIEGLSLKQVPARLAAYLLAESERAGSASFSLPQTKTAIAAQLGTIPATLSRALARLASDGLIDVHGRRIDILDRPGLGQAAGFSEH